MPSVLSQAAQQAAAEETEAQARLRAKAEAELGELRCRSADLEGQLQVCLAGPGFMGTYETRPRG